MLRQVHSHLSNLICNKQPPQIGKEEHCKNIKNSASTILAILNNAALEVLSRVLKGLRISSSFYSKTEVSLRSWYSYLMF